MAAKLVAHPLTRVAATLLMLIGLTLMLTGSAGEPVWPSCPAWSNVCGTDPIGYN